jgi:hypothetical protein
MTNGWLGGVVSVSDGWILIGAAGFFEHECHGIGCAEPLRAGGN